MIEFKKKDKVTAIQIVGGRLNPEKRLKELNLDTNPEWTIHYFFKTSKKNISNIFGRFAPN